MNGSNPDFRLLGLTRSVYFPNLLFAIGQGAAIPVVALLALDLGATPAVAGLVVALRGVGTMIFDIPAGALVAKLGEKRAMVVSTVALTATSLGVWLQPTLWLYVALMMLMGGTWAIWIVARIAFAAGSSPPQYRGRVMAMVAGIHRIGLLIGPLIGGLAIANGDLHDPFLILAILSAAASVAMAMAPTARFIPEPASNERGAVSTVGVMSAHRKALFTAGLVAVVSQVLRSSRQALIPLWGDQIGIDAATISLLFALSAGVESLLFYPVGHTMDRFGRKRTALPSIGLMTIGIVGIPLTDGVASLALVALALGLANGLGSGMNMTLGSDLAPLVGRSRFLGVWRLISDLGNAGGPMLVAVVASAATLGAAATAVGAVGIVGFLVLWRAVPETLETADV